MIRHLAPLALLLCGACARPQANYLDGSLADLVDLSFDDTRVRLYDSELSIEYTDSTRLGIVAIRVTLDNDGAIEEGTRYDLVSEGHVGSSDELAFQLPHLESGHFKLTRYDEEENAPVRGSFSAAFDTEDGSRLTVFGGFYGYLEVVWM